MSQNHNYLEAVQAGDLSAVKDYLGLPEVDINYLDEKLQSALHRSVKAITNSQQMVEYLIKAGIDCSLLDENNQTAAEFAKHEGRCDLMLLMLECEFRDLPEREVFYQLLRRGNMELICVYVEQKNISDQDMIRFTEEAYGALLMKGVRLKEQFRYEVEQKLVNYYSANPTASEGEVNNDLELLKYIDFVLQNTDESDLHAMSDEVLMALRQLVKLMFTGKQPDNVAIKEVRSEVQLCLCAFVAVFDEKEDTVNTMDTNKQIDEKVLYSLIINKQMVMRYLQLHAKQLKKQPERQLSRMNGTGSKSSRSDRKKTLWATRRASRRDRRWDRDVRKHLGKTFVLLKDVNSVVKIVNYLKKACEMDLKQHGDRVVHRLVMDRCIQVVGEAIKNTELSPNLSTRIQTALEYMVSSGTASTYRSTRKLHSHGYPMLKYLLEKETDFDSYEELQKKFKFTLSFFKCVLSTLLTVISKRFLGSLYSMKTSKEMNSLVMTLNESKRVIESFHNSVAITEMFYSEKVVMQLVNYLKPMLQDDSLNYPALINLERRLQHHFECISGCINDHQQTSQGFGECVNTAMFNNNVDSIRSVLKCILSITCSKYCMNFFSQGSLILKAHLLKFTQGLMWSYASEKDQGLIMCAIQLYSQLNGKHPSEVDRIQQMQENRAYDRYLKEILHECGASENEITKISKKKLKSMSHVFNVEEQLKVLALPDSPKLDAFRKKQEDKFQKAFDQKVALLRDLLFKYSKMRVPGPYVYIHVNYDKTVEIAIEHVVLEIYEILHGLGITKPNKHLLNYPVPVICGKNFRNGLAHDMLMYNVISGNRSYLICNAIYYAELSIKLYEESSDEPAQVAESHLNKAKKKSDNIPQLVRQSKCSKTFDKFNRFSKLQRNLYDQLEDMETFKFKHAGIDEPDILGCRRDTKYDGAIKRYTTLVHDILEFRQTTTHDGTIKQYTTLDHAVMHNDRIFVDHIDGSKYSKTAQRLINAVEHPVIPRKSNQLSAPEKANVLMKIAITANNFELFNEIRQQCNASLTNDEITSVNPAVITDLHNVTLTKQRLCIIVTTGLADISKKLSKNLLNELDIQITDENSLLTAALRYGQVENAHLLVKIVEPNENDALYAIKYNFNDILPQVIHKVIDFYRAIYCAITSNNLQAIILMEKSTNVYSNSSGLLQYAAQLKRTSILEHFLQNGKWRERINDLDETGKTVIEVCAANGSYSVVKLLFQYTTNVERAIRIAALTNQNNIVKYLLYKKPDLFPDLRIGLINQAIDNKNNSLLKYLLGHLESNKLDLTEQFLKATKYQNFTALELLLQHDPQCALAINLEECNAFHVLVLSLREMDVLVSANDKKGKEKKESRKQKNQSDASGHRIVSANGVARVLFGPLLIWARWLLNIASVLCGAVGGHATLMVSANDKKGKEKKERREQKKKDIRDALAPQTINQSDASGHRIVSAKGVARVLFGPLLIWARWLLNITSVLCGAVGGHATPMESREQKKDTRDSFNNIFDLLVAQKVNPAAKNKRGRTPLHEAISTGNLKIVRRLYTLAPQTINQSDASGHTPLITALAFAHLPVAEYLLENNADTNGLSTVRFDLGPHAFDQIYPPKPITFLLKKSPESLEYAVKTLRVNPNLTDSTGQTLLHELCQTDSAAMVEFLLERCDANISAQDNNDDTVLHHAAWWSSEAVLDYLLGRPDCVRDHPNAQLNPAAKNKDGMTPLQLAIPTGNLNIVRRLYELAPQTINQSAADGFTPLITALFFAHLSVAEYLLENNADTNVLSTYRCSGIPITFYLTKESLEYAVKTLHVNPDLTDSYGRTLLQVRCQTDDAAMVEFLLERCDANISAQDNNDETVLHHAARGNSEAVLDYLLGRPDCELDQPNAQLNPAAKNKQGKTPLHLAIPTGNLNIVRRFYELAPQTINQSDASGCTPLITALTSANLPIAKFLFENNADTNVLSTYRYSDRPITFLLKDSPESLEYAVKTLHVNPDLTDSYGRTLLHALSQTDSAAMVAFLLERCNANISAQDHYGETVLHYAIRCKSEAVLDYVLGRPDCELDQPNAQGLTPLTLLVLVCLDRSISDKYLIGSKLITAGASYRKVLQFVVWWSTTQCSLYAGRFLHDFVYGDSGNYAVSFTRISEFTRLFLRGFRN